MTEEDVYRHGRRGKVAKFYGYHRTIQDYFNSVVTAGFVVEKILEPEPYPLTKMSETERKRVPYIHKDYVKEYEIWRRIPFIILFKARKRAKSRAVKTIHARAMLWWSAQIRGVTRFLKRYFRRQLKAFTFFLVFCTFLDLFSEHMSN